MKISTVSLSTPFDYMCFFVYNNLRQLLLPAENPYLEILQILKILEINRC